MSAFWFGVLFGWVVGSLGVLVVLAILSMTDEDR